MTPPDPPGLPVARLHGDAPGHNAVVMRTVELVFQRSPGLPTGNERRIENLRYRVRRDGQVVQAARLSADGKITMRCPPGVTLVDLMAGDRVAATYEVHVVTGALPAAGNLRGQQRRLRMLGYHLGHGGPTRDGVDGTMGGRTEGAILDYQADKGLEVLGEVDGPTENGLTTDVGG